MTTPFVNRRRFERFAMRPMYTPMAARLLHEPDFAREGHVYDIGEGGIRFELDDAILPGSPVAVRITIPGPEGQATIHAFGNVVWIDDDEVNGPVRMAAVFTSFATPADKQRLLTVLSSRRIARAA